MQDTNYRPPPNLAYNLGVEIIAVLPSQQHPGYWEVYAENATGWEPLLKDGVKDGATAAAAAAAASDEEEAGDISRRYIQQPGFKSDPPPPDPGWVGVSLLRMLTADFQHYSAPDVVLNLPKDKEGAPSLKSIARNDHTGLYVNNFSLHPIQGGGGVLDGDSSGSDPPPNNTGGTSAPSLSPSTLSDLC